MRERKHLRIDDLTYIVDTREQNPFDFTSVDSRIKTASATLATGDYSIKGLEDFISIERKSEQDLLGCIGTGRARFEREIKRLLAYPCRAVIVEGPWNFLELGDYRGKVTPKAAMGSVLGWIEQGVHFFFAMNRQEAIRYTAQLMWVSANRRFRELQSLQENLSIKSEE